ncbi:MAG: radical SAM protein [Planctomycetes bacterium]|nr:radical SAM protein [Planctomycetota bacterium]
MHRAELSVPGTEKSGGHECSGPAGPQPGPPPLSPGGALDFSLGLHVPRTRRETFSLGHILIDTEEAHWIAVNLEGLELMEALGARPGRRLEELRPAGGEPRRAAERFLIQAARRGFVSNRPFARPRYTGREPFLILDRLHEFWIVPNYDCNLRCRHCYTIEQVMHNRYVLSREACRGLVDEAKALGAEIFYLTGGEVLQHPQILEIIEAIARDRKLILFTNGMLVTEEKAEFLGRFQERLIVQVSLEGHDEAHNARIRGKGAFAPALAGLRRLLRAGVRVGVSSTPTRATKDSIPLLTEQLCGIEENGRRPEYHHLIMLLEVGGIRRHPLLTLLGPEAFSEVLDACVSAAQRGNAAFGSGLKVANQKILHACASNGPKKDFCGAGYTILGVDPEGNLKTCAATINDSRFNLGKLLDDRGRYLPGRLEQLWREGERTKWVRQFTLARREGEPEDDLRFFHGGACWYNMPDPEKPLSRGHPFYSALEAQALKAIRQEAERKARPPVHPGPALLAYMHRARIACAGGRKTLDRSESGLDNGYCICFA